MNLAAALIFMQDCEEMPINRLMLSLFKFMELGYLRIMVIKLLSNIIPQNMHPLNNLAVITR